jgi:hypothetical protein
MPIQHSVRESISEVARWRASWRAMWSGATGVNCTTHVSDVMAQVFVFFMSVFLLTFYKGFIYFSFSAFSFLSSTLCLKFYSQLLYESHTKNYTETCAYKLQDKFVCICALKVV